eukprot:TRINITY_DN123_c10_g1_i1.p1 TRINITY_DN123_c10_g1~~TRINITY_DN123_c10_g1_i1.p1  ORF type:complete len:451 (+),score=81.06 TRINITY_DN123_c10_g1_i1:173-1525(+)
MSSSKDIDQFCQSIKQNKSIKWLRATFCANSGVLKAKSFYTQHPHFGDFVKNGIGLATGVQGLPAHEDHIAEGSDLTAAGEARLVPDITSMRTLPCGTRASCMSDLYDVAPDGSMHPCELCPRTYLKNQIAKLAQFGYSIKCGYEFEFSVFVKDKDGKYVAEPGTFCNVYAENKLIFFINDLTDALVAQGVMPELSHKEAGDGQIEFVLLYDDPLKAADDNLVVRETIQIIAEKHQVKASLLPKISENMGAGNHIHISLWKDGKNVTGAPDGFSTEGNHFVAGIFDNLKALMAITTPTMNSFRRLKPGYFAGAYHVWGWNNKEAAIRIPGGTQIPSHFELKTVDATSNPYLTIGSIIVCGLDGLKNKRTLPKPVSLDPGSLTPEEREKLSIVQLPASLLSVLEHLKTNTALINALGPKLSKAYIAVKTYEAQTLSKLTLEEEVQLLLTTY